MPTALSLSMSEVRLLVGSVGQVEADGGENPDAEDGVDRLPEFQCVLLEDQKDKRHRGIPPVEEPDKKESGEAGELEDCENTEREAAQFSVCIVRTYVAHLQLQLLQNRRLFVLVDTARVVGILHESIAAIISV